MKRRHDIRCIVPPNILEKLMQRPDLRETALRTMLTGAAIRERRTIMSALPKPHAPGDLRRIVSDAQNGSRPEGVRVVRRENDAANADTAVNEAYDGLGATYELFKLYGRNSIDDKGLPLLATVHFEVDFQNAFWDGSEMVFGDGDGQAFVRGAFTKAIDVIGHELTHGVTENTAGLEYHDQPGALNESISDVFGSLVKQYVLGQSAAQADWLIGAGILGPALPGVALRSLKAPGTAFAGDDQPSNMSGYVRLPNTRAGDNGGVHTNSGIPNHAFYLVATALGGNAWDDAGQIWYASLKQLWPLAEFQDMANVSYQVAGTIFGAGSRQQITVQEAWREVGLAIKTTGQGVRITKRDGKVAEHANGDLKKHLQQVAQELQRTIDQLA